MARLDIPHFELEFHPDPDGFLLLPHPPEKVSLFAPYF